MSIDCVWSEAGDDDRIIGWAHRAWDWLRPFPNGGVYLNFAGFEGEHNVEATLGSNLARLERVRCEYDPDGLFEAASRRP